MDSVTATRDTMAQTRDMVAVAEDKDAVWVSVSEAADIAQVSVRTVGRWVSDGKVTSRLVEVAGHRVREIRRDTLADPGIDSGQRRPASVRDTGHAYVTDVRDDGHAPMSGGRDNGHGSVSDGRDERHAPPSDGRDTGHAPAELVDRLRVERDRALQALRGQHQLRQASEREAEFLRNRVVEGERAAEQLRTLLLASERNVQALTEQVRTLAALPPAPDPEPPRPRRWWWPWR